MPSACKQTESEKIREMFRHWDSLCCCSVLLLVGIYKLLEALLVLNIAQG